MEIKKTVAARVTIRDESVDVFALDEILETAINRSDLAREARLSFTYEKHAFHSRSTDLSHHVPTRKEKGIFLEFFLV